MASSGPLHHHGYDQLHYAGCHRQWQVLFLEPLCSSIGWTPPYPDSSRSHRHCRTRLYGMPANLVAWHNGSHMNFLLNAGRSHIVIASRLYTVSSNRDQHFQKSMTLGLTVQAVRQHLHKYVWHRTQHLWSCCKIQILNCNTKLKQWIRGRGAQGHSHRLTDATGQSARCSMMHQRSCFRNP